MNTEQLIRNAPRLTESEEKELNKRFQAYFFLGAGGEVWATCCGMHKVLDYNNDEEYELLTATHCPEPKFSWGQLTNQRESELRVRCPWCGKMGKAKRLQYTGRRKNLREYRRCVVLRWWKGALWAVAYDLWKSYTNDLLPRIQTHDLGIFRFRPGKAEGCTRYWWGGSSYEYAIQQTKPGEGGSRSSMWRLHAPYGYKKDWGKSFDAIGLDETLKSPLRYCAIGESARLIEMLTACCFYPRQIEMLQKGGMSEFVEDLLEGKKNASLINWEAERPKDFVRGLTRDEIRAVKGKATHTKAALRSYKVLKGTKAQTSMEDCCALAGALCSYTKEKQLMKWMKETGLSGGKLLRYLKGQKSERQSLADVLGLYIDYADEAGKLGMDTENPIIQMPENLMEKHDRYTLADTALYKEKEETDYRENRLPKLKKKYLWWDDLFLIRPALSGAEIIREGKTLKHCVGGYADRHLTGRTVILFLRRKDAPGKPLVTIEMNGNQIVQAHGYRNEMCACPENPERKPIENLYRAVLESWSAWLSGGSKRSRNGIPKEPKEPKEAVRRKTA